MALLKIKDFDPDYGNTFGGDDIIGQDVYTQGTVEKIGTVNDILVDESTGQFRYILVNLSVGMTGKKVLLPVGRSQMNQNEDRVYARLTKEQANNLPELEAEAAVDYDYEERVRGVYRPDTTMSSVTPMAPLESATLETSAALDSAYVAPIESRPLDASAALNPDYSAPVSAMSAPVSQPTYNRDTYKYQEEPSLYEMNPADHSTLRLYEERLIANKKRMKTGEVAVGKHVETETARVSVPVEKERVVIERVTPADAGRAVTPGTADFREGEVAHVEIYEETPDIRKEAFVREEVKVTKVVDQEMVEAQETIRREELDVDTDGRPVLDRPDSGTSTPRRKS